MNIGIISFNSAAITKKMEEAKNISIINLEAIIDGEIITNLELKEFFEKVEKSKNIPTTSQPIKEHIVEVYKNMLERYSHILVLTPEKSLSGTHQNAVLSIEELSDDEQKKIYIVETKSFAFSESILADRAIDLIKDNKNVEEIIEELKDLANRITTYLVPGNLNYLKKSGRVNTAQLVIGKLIVLKLLIRHNQAEGDGSPKIFKKVRGDKKLFKEISDVLSNNDNIENIYAGDIIADKYVSDFKKILPANTIYTNKVSIIIASHLGPQTFGFAVVEKK